MPQAQQQQQQQQEAWTAGSWVRGNGSRGGRGWHGGHPVAWSTGGTVRAFEANTNPQKRPAPPSTAAQKVLKQSAEPLTPETIEKGMIVQYQPGCRGWVDTLYRSLNEFWVRDEKTGEVVLEQTKGGTPQAKPFRAESLRFFGAWARHAELTEEIPVPPKIAAAFEDAGGVALFHVEIGTDIPLKYHPPGLTGGVQVSAKIVVGPAFPPRVRVAARAIRERLRSGSDWEMDLSRSSVNSSQLQILHQGEVSDVVDKLPILDRPWWAEGKEAEELHQGVLPWECAAVEDTKAGTPTSISVASLAAKSEVQALHMAPEVVAAEAVAFGIVRPSWVNEDGADIGTSASSQLSTSKASGSCEIAAWWDQAAQDQAKAGGAETAAAMSPEELDAWWAAQLDMADKLGPKAAVREMGKKVAQQATNHAPEPQKLSDTPQLPVTKAQVAKDTNHQSAVGKATATSAPQNVTARPRTVDKDTKYQLAVAEAAATASATQNVSEPPRTVMEWAKCQDQFSALPPLQEGWIRIKSHSGRIYFLHTGTGETTFENAPLKLPPGWKRCVSRRKHKVFYWHKESNKTQLDPPKFEQLNEPAAAS